MRSTTPAAGPRVGLLLPGQGSQHPRMAAGLYGHDETFTTVMDETFALFETDGPALREEWLAERPSPLYDDVTVAQPLLYAVNHALARVVLSWGVRPAGLVGHSVGEVAAATLAGVLSLKDGVRLMRARMRQFAQTPPGGMLAVAATVEEISDLLGDDVHLAAVNATRQLLLAGESDHLERTRRTLADRGVVCRYARARQAFHSPAVAAAVTASLPDWHTVALQPPQLPLHSAYLDGPLDPGQALDPEFWARQPERTVYFAAALNRLLAEGVDVLIEAGPGAGLSALARRHRAVHAGGCRVVPLLPDSSGAAGDRQNLADARARLAAR